MSKTKSALIKVLLSSSIRDRESGRRFIETLITTAPQYAPERYNHFEPINKTFDVLKLEDALQSWGSSFLWRRSKPTVEGSAWMGGHNTHDAVYLWMSPKAMQVRMAKSFLSSLHGMFGVDFGYMHIDTDVDTIDLEQYRRYLMPLSQGLTTYDLREGLPNMPWAALFGPPYVELFGREALLGAPAARVESIGEAVYVQLTDDPNDVAAKREEYVGRQVAVKEHLNQNAFRGASTTQKCRVPEFSLRGHSTASGNL